MTNTVSDLLLRADALPLRTDPQQPYIRPCLEAWGIVFGAPIPDNQDFVFAKLPPGWRKTQTDHPMWVYVVDANNNIRCRIFWKGESSKEAPMILGVRPRFVIHIPLTPGKDGHIRALVMEDNKIVFSTEPQSASFTEADFEAWLAGKHLASTERQRNFERLQSAKAYYAWRCAAQDARDWIKSNHPKWGAIADEYPVE